MYKIFITPACGFCHHAIQILERNKVPFEVFERTQENTDYLFELKPELKDTQYTYPQVFVGKKSIGGCDDLIQYEENCLWVQNDGF